MQLRTHTLKEYIHLLEEQEQIKYARFQDADLQKEIVDLSYNSKEIKKDGIFVCKGTHFSQEYLEEAIEKGAACFISEVDYDVKNSEFPRIIVYDIRRTMALLANYYYGEIWRVLKLIGITGTKGKSTTTYYVKYILDHYLKRLGKKKSAVISGIDTEDGVISEESHITTPESLVLHRHFWNAVSSGMDFLEMEVSSQALKYDRTYGVTFDVGCFLNIAEDHISPIEHSDFDDYFDSKLKLMKQCKIACVNIDASHSKEVCNTALKFSNLVTFGTDEKADFYGHRIVIEKEYTRFMVRTPDYTEEFRLTMPGLFNVENALAAIAICHSLHIPKESIYEGLLKAKVSGRMETYWGENSKVLVIVDYAHNQLSFERLFTSTIKEYPDRRIFAIYGCPGGKALARRRELTEIAGRYSEKIFITEEDAGEEPLENICDEIARYAKKEEASYEIVEDRGEAIKKAIEEADEKTVILLTGKGRETRQKRGTQYIECPSDVDYVLKYLR